MKRNRLTILCILLLLGSALFAQSGINLPVDPNVRYGKLKNGLTYYIRHNAYPEKRADFYIAQNVGSILEDDSQAGLAHFLEHMAFNGTKNFPGRKTMLDYLEKNGVKFGENVNAYTAFDETVYNLSDIPVTRGNLIDSCLLILHDWSGFITLDNAEIDKERKIINEEWRTRNNANIRSMERLLKFAFEGTRYENRMPIGSMDIVMNFPHQTLKDYYHKWYRPDLQAIVIVGDIDVDKTEANIKKMFADIKAPVNPAKRTYFEVPDYTAPRAITITDKETTSTNIAVYYTHSPQTKNTKQTEAGYRENLLQNMVSGMLSARYSEIAQKPDAPFIGAAAGNGDFIIVPTKEAWSLNASCKGGEVETALKAILTENERALRYGFTQTELNREKDNYLTMVDNAYNNRNKQMNSSYVREYVSNFTNGEPIPGIEYEHALVKRLLENIDTKAVNDCLKKMCANKNVLISVMGPQKDNLTYPSDQTLIDIFNNISKIELTPYIDKELPSTLIDKMPKAGHIVKESRNENLGAIEWTLDNGIKVIAKKTDFKDDQILFSSVAYGGTSIFDDSEVLNAKLVRNVIALGGIGQFSAIDLSKMMAGKSANVSVSISATTQGLSGASSAKDLETMMQLAYLTITQPRKDTEAYESYLVRLKTQLQNISSSPSTALSDSLMSSIYGNNPRVKRIGVDDIDKFDYDRIIEMYKELFANPSTQTFTFIGSIDENVLKPLIEKYLGALPNTGIKSEYRKANSDMRKGEYTNIFTQKMENPKASSVTLYWGNLNRNLKSNITASILEQILDIVYVRTIREAEGGTYGVSTNVGIEREPYDGRTTLQIVFDTDSEKEKHLRQLAQKELLNIASNGPAEEDFNKTIEYMEKSMSENVKTNGYWLSVLSSFYFYGEDYYTTYQKVLKEIKPSDVQQMVKDLTGQGNKTEVVMMPQNN